MLTMKNLDSLEAKEIRLDESQADFVVGAEPLFGETVRLRLMCLDAPLRRCSWQVKAWNFWERFSA